jgi:ribosomal protein S18 acetylase RimI-like enzyme
MGATVSEMKPADYDEAWALWRDVEGVGLHDDVDSRKGIAAYLARNPHTSQVARHDGRMVGAVLCGHDGRRGYLHHLAVAVEWRKQGVGRALVDACLASLISLGIPKCNIFLFTHNETGEAFWKRTGWNERADLKVLQRSCSSGNIQ